MGISFVTFDSTSGKSGAATPRIFVGVANLGSTNIMVSNDAGATCQYFADINVKRQRSHLFSRERCCRPEQHIHPAQRRSLPCGEELVCQLLQRRWSIRRDVRCVVSLSFQALQPQMYQCRLGRQAQHHIRRVDGYHTCFRLRPLLRFWRCRRRSSEAGHHHGRGAQLMVA